MSSALVVGKFYPPHAGHVLLVQRALQARGRVVVLCLGSARDTYTPWQRARALAADLVAAGLNPGAVEIRAGLDETPFDLDSEPVWRSHVEIFRSHLKAGDDVDLLVSSEAYGDELADRLGLAHLCADLDRRAVPVSASDIRADPLAHWDDLGPGTRRMLTARVVVVGAESTGTTTVACELAARLRARGGAWERCTWVPEYGHELTEAKQERAAAVTGVRPLSVEWDVDDFAEVVRVQGERERAALAEGGPVLVCDTDAFATPVWERRYLGDAARLDASTLGEGDVYLLTHHEGVPFVQDGTRDGEHLRAWMTDGFASALVGHGKPWAVLTGSLGERLTLAERITDELVQRRLSFSDPI
jgi:NadR type nicotinamide-nucleotide adenylyltransferase